MTSSLPGTMPAFRLSDWGTRPELVEVPVPAPSAGEVLVEVAGCGLCHSDLTMMSMPGEVGSALGWRVPFTLGHEVAGHVAAIGEGVTGFVEGDPVAVVSAHSCGVCDPCRRGHSTACVEGLAGRGYGWDGGLARYLLVRSVRDLVPLGDLDPTLAGPLTDAGATSHHAVRRALGQPARSAPEGRSPDPDVVAAVIGVGGLGGFTVQILRARGGVGVIAVERDPGRRAAARDLGAEAVVEGVDGGTTAALLGLSGGVGVDAVIDNVGTDDTIRAGLGALRPGGSFVLVGAGGGTLRGAWMQRLPAEVAVSRIQGSERSDLVAMVKLARTGEVRVTTDTYALVNVASAYAALEDGNLRGRAVVIP